MYSRVTELADDLARKVWFWQIVSMLLAVILCCVLCASCVQQGGSRIQPVDVRTDVSCAEFQDIVLSFVELCPKGWIHISQVAADSYHVECVYTDAAEGD